jgi:hypothetical protein
MFQKFSLIATIRFKRILQILIRKNVKELQVIEEERRKDKDDAKKKKKDEEVIDDGKNDDGCDDN